MNYFQTKNKRETGALFKPELGTRFFFCKMHPQKMKRGRLEFAPNGITLHSAYPNAPPTAILQHLAIRLRVKKGAPPLPLSSLLSRDGWMCEVFS